MKHLQKYTRNRARNWGEYNQALVKRGSLTLWVDEDVLEQWYHTSDGQRRSRGGQRTYSDAAITMMATLQQVYRLPLRQTVGLLTSILQALGQSVAVPDHTTLGRRRMALEIKLPRVRANEPIHLLVDSTGFKIYGNGEWMRLKHRNAAKNRRWRKLHLAVDGVTLSIVAAELSDNDKTDGQLLPRLLEQISAPLKQVIGDGAYDKWKCYEAIRDHNDVAAGPARAVIRPQKNARIKQDGDPAIVEDRNQNVSMIAEHGLEEWKRDSGYSRRALVETTMSRLKTIFGDRVRSKRIEAQRTELLLRCVALERMTALGLPPAA